MNFFSNWVLPYVALGLQITSLANAGSGLGGKLLRSSYVAQRELRLMNGYVTAVSALRAMKAR
jgi:hypothetical protein